MNLVVKVPVRIDESDDALKNLKYRLLREMMHECRFLGNMAIRYTIAFRLPGIPKEIDPATGKPVAMDTKIYRILAEKRKWLSAATVSTMARNYAARLLKNTDRDAWAGRKSLPTYRSSFIIFRSDGTKIVETGSGKDRQFSIEMNGFAHALSDEFLTEQGVTPATVPVEKRGIKLVSVFSWKDQGAASVVSRIVSGEYVLSDSQLKEGDKWLLAFLSYKFTPERKELNPEVVCGVDLGVNISAVCAVNNGPQRMYLGNRSVVESARWKFRERRFREQKRLGLASKSVGWKCSEKEVRWIKTYYHSLTRGVIDFCLQHGCGKLQVEDLTSLRASQKENEYQRLMWIPSTFLNLLIYKAKIAGIELVKINPKNTSCRCSVCGHIAKKNRKSQQEFVCMKCGEEMNADYNAARNIALATGKEIETGYVSTEA